MGSIIAWPDARLKWRRRGSRDRPWSAGPQSTPFIFLLVIVSQNGRLRRRARRQRGGRPGNPSPASRTRLEIKLSPLAPARFTGGRALVVLNLGSRRALRDDQRRNQRQWPTCSEAVRSSTCVGSVLGRKALGITNRTRKTGLDRAMISEDASFIVAPAQRAHDTHLDDQFKIQALSNGRQPGGDLLGNPVSVR